MAAPTKQGTTTTYNMNTFPGATSHPIPLPSGIVPGETLIIEVFHKALAGEATIAGWTRFIDKTFETQDHIALSVFWKKAEGDEGSTATFTTTTLTRAAAIARRWSGTTDPTITAPEGSATTQANTTTPNPPFHTLTEVADFMVVAVFASSQGRLASVYPTNYTTDQQTAGSDSGLVTNAGGGSAGRALTAGTGDDPGAFTTTGIGSEETASATYIIFPTGAGGGTSDGDGSFVLQPMSFARGKRVRQSDTASLTGEPANWGLSPHRVAWWNGYRKTWDGIVPLQSPPAVGNDDWWLVTDIPGDARPQFMVDTRPNARPDTRWDEANKKLYVFMGGSTGGGRMYTYDYNDVLDSYTVDVSNVAVGINVQGSDTGSTMHVTPNGYIWIVSNSDTIGLPSAIGVVRSADGGATWSSVINLKTTKAVGKASISHFTNAGTTYICIAAAENGLDVPTNDAILHFLYIDQNSAGYTTPANWTDETASVPSYGAFVECDDEASITRDDNNNLYIVAETEHLRVNTSGVDPQWILLRRTPAGVWAKHDIAFFDTTESRKRPTITIDDANEILYVFANRENERIVYRSAPVASWNTLNAATEWTLFSDDLDSFRNVHSPERVTAESNLLVMADNQTHDYEVFTLLGVPGDEELLNAVLVLTGQVWVAPVGTFGPTSATSTLDAAFKDMGFLSDAGITFRDQSDIVPKSSWNSVYTKEFVMTQRKVTAAFALREYNKRAVEFALGGSVTQNSAEWKTSTPGLAVPRSLVIDASDGSVNIRIYFPSGVVEADTQSRYTRTTSADLPVVIGASQTAGNEPYTVFISGIDN